MLTFFFRARCQALAIRKLKDLRNPHLCFLWQGTEDDLKALEVLKKVGNRE